MPWKTLNNWLFDGSRQSPVPEILYDKKSPITPKYLIKMFMNHGPLNRYLNEYLNTLWIFSLEKEELLRFIKNCVIDYKVKKGSLFYSKRKSQDKLFDILRERIPFLKNDDLTLLVDVISSSSNRDEIYETLGLDVPKVKKSKKTKPKKISQKNYLNENYVVIELK